MRRAFHLYVFGTLLAVGVFLVQPQPAAYVGIVLSIPHWPARVLHWLGIGGPVNGLAFPATDWLLHLTGRHPLLHAAILCVLLLAAAGGLTTLLEALRKSPGKRTILLLALPLLSIIGFAFVSAWLSGMHLSRLSSYLEKPSSGRAETFAVADLLIGTEPIDEKAASRTLRRLARISGGESLIGGDANDVLVASHQAKIEESFKKLRGTIEQATPRRERSQALVMATLLELAQEFQAAVLVSTANQGRGGEPGQPWRHHSFQGPLGPITVRTNFLPPDPKFVPLLPGALAGGTRESAAKIKLGATGFADSAATSYFAHVDKIAEVFSLTDAIVRMWYTTLANYYISRSLLNAFVGNKSPGKLADSDSYGELTVNLHNSCESYSRAVGGHVGDLVAAGVYLAHSNQVHVWMDERQYERLRARELLDMTAAILANLDSLSRDSLLESEILGAVALAQPPDRIAAVLTHELTHWSVHALLSDMPWLELDQSQAFVEGIALMFDNLSLEFTEEDLVGALNSVHPEFGAAMRRGRSSDLATPRLYESARSGRCPGYVHKSIDVACEWLGQPTHLAYSPRHLAALSPKRFFDQQNFRANYADAWALVRLFGSRALGEAMSRRVSIQDVLKADPFYATPWWVLQNDVKSQQLPAEVMRIFRKCL